MIYLGGALTQIDGSSMAQSNCVIATVSEEADCSSLGYWKLKLPVLRKLTGDTSGGVNYNLARDTVKMMTGGEVVLTVLYWAPETVTNSTLTNLLDAPRVAGTIISCAVTRYTPFRTGTYTGMHSVNVGAKRIATVTRADGTKYQQKQVYVMDPGHSVAQWVWWPLSLLTKAAAASAGAGKIHLIYTRDLGAVNRIAHEDGSIRSSTKVINSPSNIVGKITKDTAYQVVSTVKGTSYTLDGKTMDGWNKLGTNKYCVAKIR